MRLDSEVMIPLTKLSCESLTVIVRRVIAILDEARAATAPDVVQGTIAADDLGRGIPGLPGQLEELCCRSTESL